MIKRSLQCTARRNKVQLVHFCSTVGEKNFLMLPSKTTWVVQKFYFCWAVLCWHGRVWVVVLLLRTVVCALLVHEIRPNCKFDKMLLSRDVRYPNNVCRMINSSCSKEKTSSKKPRRQLSSSKGQAWRMPSHTLLSRRVIWSVLQPYANN